jgi:flavin reductase (DIM6/NTAB) family NADH-FMN oxidoreductase RutF
MDTKELRSTFGQFATGVCVVSCAHQGKNIGMTINSLSSVSLTPALLQWNIQQDSDCFDAFINAETFSVCVLAAEQMDQSNAYAQKGGHEIAADEIITGATGVPLIKGAIASFECSRWAVYPGGDHEIIIGEIHQVHRAHGDPLLFFAGQYRELAKNG